MADASPQRGRMQDKVAVVTGASSGIGRAIALAYAKEGAKVVCADISPTARAGVAAEEAQTTLQLLTKEVGEERAIAVKADVSSAEDVQHLFEETVKRFGRLDVLVNNAAITLPRQRLHELADDQWEKIMAIDVRSVFLCCKAAIGQMLKQEPHSSGDRGWIINMSSVAALRGIPGIGAYSAAKSAILGLTRQIGLDYASDRIHCNAICPGFTNTAIMQRRLKQNESTAEELARAHPFRGPGEVGDIVGPAVFLASDDAQWVTGQHIVVDGGYTAK